MYCSDVNKTIANIISLFETYIKPLFSSLKNIHMVYVWYIIGLQVHIIVNVSFKRKKSHAHFVWQSIHALASKHTSEMLLFRIQQVINCGF